MGHHLHTFIGPRAALIALAGGDGSAHVFDMPCDLAALPITWPWLNAACPPDGGPCTDDGFTRLTEALASRARAASHIAPLAYLETEYFGGVGEQRAIAWSRGGAVATGSVNRALAAIGVKRGLLRDEWDTIGLGEYRDNDRFFERGGIPLPEADDGGI